MSSAPAVPTASTQQAPTTKVESTQEAPHGQSVSQIGHEGAGPQEAMLHTGAFNSIDIYMRMQFIALASFVWTTAQAPGTLLWTVPITPIKSHQFIRHLAQMYNTWVGGFDYNIKVCGTGFHAGALAVVRIPPNIDPSSISSPADFTAFEYVIIDPKTLEVVTEHIIDQRRIMYHYMSDSGNDAIGGHIAVYVLVQLNTSSTGSQSIAVQALTRPSQDFNFFQIKPLITTAGELDPEEPTQVAKTLEVTDLTQNGTSLFKDQISKFSILPKTYTTPPYTTAVGAYNFAGVRIGTEKAGTFPVPSSAWSAGKETALEGKVCHSKPYLLEGLPKCQDKGLKIDWLEKDDSGSWGVVAVTQMNDDGDFRTCNTASSDRNKNMYTFYRITSYLEATQNIPLKPNDESYFVFKNPLEEGDQQRGSIQSEQLARLLKTGNLKDIMSSQEAMVFDMYDRDLDIPVRRLKLYYSGIITTKGVDDQVDLSANKYYFKFVQFIRASEPIPSPPKSFLVNQYISMLASKHV